MENSSFSKTNPHLQFAWDSVSLGEFKLCPYKYYLGIIESWQPKRAGHDLTFGLLFHQCFELYDRLMAEGLDHEEATLRAVHHALLHSGERDIKTVSIYEPEMVEALKTEGYSICNAPCKTDEVALQGPFTPWSDELKPKTRQNLIRSIVWYLEEFGPNAAEKTLIIDGKAAVELSFSFGTGWTLSTGEEVLLCGHLDKLATLDGKVWVFDKKTTKSTINSDFFKKFSPDNQMSLYSIAGRVIFEKDIAGVIIDGAQLAVGFTRFARGFANRTPAQLEEWLSDTQDWIEQADQCAQKKNWPMNDKSCFLCHFKEVCSKDPAVRQNFLESNYTQKVWDPLKRRGE